MKTLKTFTLTAYYTSPTFPAGTTLFEERCGRERRYFWELRNGQKQPCSPAFVKARRRFWTMKSV